MEILIILILLITLLSIWTISTQRKLTALDENVNNAMNQIGIQLSSRFDALTNLLDLTEPYAAYESRSLRGSLRSHQRVISAKSTPDKVLLQESVIFEVLEHITAIAEQYPELKTDKNYTRYMDAIDCYGKMICTASLIYNDSVAKFNRTFRLFPTNLIAGLLGFTKRDYLESPENENP